MAELARKLFNDDNEGSIGLPASTTAWLQTAGWDEESQTLRPPSKHPTLGWRACRVAGCDTPCWGSRKHQLCTTCDSRWHAGTESLTFEEFVQRPRPLRPDTQCQLVVDGARCERVQRSLGLCSAHAAAARAFKTTERPRRLQPLPSLGTCVVATCDLQAERPTQRLCRGHNKAWAALKDLDGGHLSDWASTAAPLADSTRLVLLALPSLVVRQVLFGLFTRSQRGSSTRMEWVQRAINWVRVERLATLRDVSGAPPIGVDAARVLRDLTAIAENYGAAITDFRHADRWPGTVFDRQGDVNFGAISLPWLREVARSWAWAVLHKYDDFRSIKRHVDAISHLSDYLVTHGPASGQDPRLLDHETSQAFVAYLAACVRRGTKTSDHPSAKAWTDIGVHRTLNHLRTVLRHGRDVGAVPNLPHSFAISDAMVPRRPQTAADSEDDYGRSLPVEVMRQLLSTEYLHALDELWRPDASRFFIIAAETGRRPIELTSLRLECIDETSPGGPFLIYKETKVTKGKLRKLPVHSELVSVVRKQQDYVRALYPETHDRDLVLFPRSTMNPHGKNPIGADLPKTYIREWVDSLPALLAPSTMPGGGMVPWPRERVFLYALRHTYAQRRADAGVAIHVLQDLMDHEQIQTTGVYFRVPWRQKRDATELVGSLFLNKDGITQSGTMTDEEIVRQQEGTVAVVWGGCKEPNNVAAGGWDCPIRMRCVGCEHHETNPSYLPEMKRHLEELLAERARIDAFTGGAAWARAQARPSDEEIEALRKEIEEQETLLEAASPEFRREIEEASSALRRIRGSVGLTLRTGLDGADTLQLESERRRAAATIVEPLKESE